MLVCGENSCSTRVVDASFSPYRRCLASPLYWQRESQQPQPACRSPWWTSAYSTMFPGAVSYISGNNRIHTVASREIAPALTALCIHLRADMWAALVPPGLRWPRSVSGRSATGYRDSRHAVAWRQPYSHMQQARWPTHMDGSIIFWMCVRARVTAPAKSPPAIRLG